MTTVNAPQARIAIGFAMVGGQKVPITVDIEWMRFFSEITAQSNSYQLSALVGAQGAIGASLMIDGGGEGGEVEFVPGPQGQPGPRGDQGPPGFAFQDSDDSADFMFPPGTIGAITLTGDVTGSGMGAFAATIANDAVTYAKLQNVAVTDRILGRDTVGAGDVEELTLSQVLDFVGSAAQGDVLYRGAATWARLGAGTSGQVLQTGGAAANPSWATVNATGVTPSFSVYLSANQSVASGVWTKINLNTEEFDTTSAWDPTTNYRFTPAVAGYYILTGILDSSASAATTALTMAIYKNGASFKVFGYSNVSTGSRVSGSAIVQLNGSTDYIEFYGYLTGTTPAFTSSNSYGCAGALLVRT